MEESKLKNMIILKNLPSNIIDEAIVVLKSNKQIKKLEKVDKTEKIKQKKNNREYINSVKDKEYILKEAEMIVNNYIDEVEEKENKNNFKFLSDNKYKKLKTYSLAITLFSVLEMLVIICQ